MIPAGSIIWVRTGPNALEEGVIIMRLEEGYIVWLERASRYYRASAGEIRVVALRYGDDYRLMVDLGD